MGSSRATGCTRFIVAMLIIIPLAIGASMMITGDSIDFRGLLNQWLGNKTEVKETKSSKKEKTISLKDKLNEKKGSTTELKNIGDFKDRIKTLEAEVDDKNEKLEFLFDKLQKSEKELEAAKKEISRLKRN